MELETMAIAMPAVDGHPNRQDFRGVLTLVDVASDKPPAGARGHRVVLTRGAAERALPSLLGMALDWTAALDRHDCRHKVGIITGAEIVGRTVEVRGYVFAKDFPEVIESMRAGERGGPALGMSYEVTGVRVSDTRSAVWMLMEVTFTGAAILRQDKAAYARTWIEVEGMKRPRQSVIPKSERK
jgi:hypothetical protein